MIRRILVSALAVLAAGCAATHEPPAAPATPPPPVAAVGPKPQAAPPPKPVPPPAVKDSRAYRAQFGDWKVGCVDNPVNFTSHCKAETIGSVIEFRGEPGYRPHVVLWVSWLKGQPKDSRSICVFGQDYPVEQVTLQIDRRKPVELEARKASGCFVANEKFLRDMRAGKDLYVTFTRWPWGEARALVSLKKSGNALKELNRLVDAR